MNITQRFYDNLASHYDKLFLDWHGATREQAAILNRFFRAHGLDTSASVLDCACGIGTQAIGLAALGYGVTASDISPGALAEAKQRAEEAGVSISFVQGDFRTLQERFPKPFDIVICMDNALPHMLTPSELAAAIQSITNQIAPGGMFVASIRDYDALLETKPPYSPPYIHPTAKGRRISFQTWHWEADCYTLTQYIIEDEDSLQINKFDCQYRATRRDELTKLLLANGCREIEWKFPEETGFYQPLVIARK